MNTMNNIRIGSDFELFLSNTEEIVESPSSTILGAKGNENIHQEGIMTSKDGASSEVAIPCTNHRETFINLVESGLSITETISKLKVTSVTSHSFKKLSTEGQILGCSPSYGMHQKVSLKPEPILSKPLFRTAGGHLHIDSSPENNERLTYWLDCLLGIPSVLEDTDVQRRELYGVAGDVRLKSYGIEYRTLSSYWVHSRVSIGRIFDRVQRASYLTASGVSVPLSSQMIQGIINNSDREYATMVLNRELKEYHIN